MTARIGLFVTLAVIAFSAATAQPNMQMDFRLLPGPDYSWNPSYSQDVKYYGARIYAKGGHIQVMRMGGAATASTDGGVTWQRSIYGSYGISHLEIARDNKLLAIWWLGFDPLQGGVFLSEDNGATWKLLKAAREPFAMALDSNNVLTVSFLHELWHYDLKTSTADTESTPGMILSLAAGPDNKLFGWNQSSRKVSYTTNYGNTWTDIPAQLNNQPADMIVLNKHVLLGFNSALLSCNQVDGTLKTLVETPGQIRAEVTYHKNQAHTKAFVADSIIYSIIDSSLQIDTLTLNFHHSGEYVTAADLDDSETWHILSNRGNYYTCAIDGGTLNYRSNPVYFVPSIGLWKVDNGLYMNHYNDMFVTHDDGSTWGVHEVDGLFEISSVGPNGSVYYVAEGDSSYILYSFDPDNSQKAVVFELPDGSSDVYIDWSSQTFVSWNGPSVEVGRYIHKSTDAGQSWEKLDIPDSVIISARYHAVSGLIARCGSPDGISLHRYEEVTSSWTNITPIELYNTKNVLYDTDGNMYLTDRNGMMYSADKGDTWQYLTRMSTESYLSEILLDIDRSGNVITKSSITPSFPATMFIYNFKQQFRGEIPLNNVLGLPYYAKFGKDDILYVYTTYGLYKAESPLVLAGNDLAQPLSFSLAQSYPNPVRASEAVTITYELPRGGDAVLTVYDIHGRVVERREVSGAAPGTHSTSINLSGHPAGVYMYTLSSGGTVQTRKMVVLR